MATAAAGSPIPTGAVALGKGPSGLTTYTMKGEPGLDPSFTYGSGIYTFNGSSGVAGTAVSASTLPQAISLWETDYPGRVAQAAPKTVTPVKAPLLSTPAVRTAPIQKQSVPGVADAPTGTPGSPSAATTPGSPANKALTGLLAGTAPVAIGLCAYRPSGPFRCQGRTIRALGPG